jgi:hypothetical protein
MAGLTQHLNGLNLQLPAGVPTSTGHVPAPAQDNGWLPNGADNMMFYPNGGVNGGWADPRSGTALL